MEEQKEKPLNKKESLELISRMINNTQQRMKEGSGTAFLIWGYTTVMVTLAVWALLLYTKSYHSQWFWFLLPIIGAPLTIIHSKKKRGHAYVYTYVDKVVSYIWLVLGVTGFLLSCISIIHRLPILFMIVLIMGIGTALTGLVIRFRPVAIAGFIGMAASISLTFVSWTIQMPLFAFIFVFMMIIPGHYLNYKARKSHA